MLLQVTQGSLEELVAEPAAELEPAGDRPLGVALDTQLCAEAGTLRRFCRCVLMGPKCQRFLIWSGY